MTDPKDGIQRDLVQLLTEHLDEVTRLRSARDDLQRFEQRANASESELQKLQLVRAELEFSSRVRSRWLETFKVDVEKREEFLKNEVDSLRRDVASLKVERDSLAKANIQIAAAIGVVPSNVWVIPGKTFQPTTVAERVQRLAEAYKSTEAALKGVQAMTGQLSEPERAKHRAELEEVKCLAMSGRKHHQEFRRKIANQVRQLVGLARMASIVEAVDKTIAMRLLAICREYEAGPY